MFSSIHILGSVISALWPFCCCLGLTGDIGDGPVTALSEWLPKMGMEHVLQAGSCTLVGWRISQGALLLSLL